MIGRLAGRTARLAAERRGGVVIIFALTLPVFLMVVGMAIDYGFMSVRKTDLQAAADAAALAGAREMQLANADESTAQSVSKSVAMANLEGNSGGVTVTTKVSSDPVAVSVEITQSPGLIFVGGLIGADDVDINVRATARVVGNLAICVLALEPVDNAIWLQNSARITGTECGVYSNSTKSSGISTKGKDSILQSQLTCSAGGFKGDNSTYKPLPLTDCPPIEDPLANRDPPFVGACTATDLVLKNTNTTLSPGVYCGGLKITGNSDVTLDPGTYVIKDGPFVVDGKSSLVADNVGFYLLGDPSTFEFGGNTTIRLTAPVDGPMAGLLFFEDRDAPFLRTHKIKSNDAKLLLGTFYLPRGRVKIDAKNKIANESAYTVVIARQLKLYAGPNLVLNTDYGDSDIPIPPGLQGVSGKEIVLSE